MYKKILLLILVLVSLSVSAQTFTDSNLPIVVIETDGGANIPDEPKVPGSMKIIWHPSSFPSGILVYIPLMLFLVV